MSGKKRSSSSVSVLQIILMVTLVLIAMIGIAFMLIPRKPVAPPVSRVSYEERPESQKKNYSPVPSIESSEPAPITEPQKISEKKVIEEKPAEPEKELPFHLLGTVVDQKTSKPIAGARVRVQRKTSAEDEVLFASFSGEDEKTLRQRAKEQQFSNSNRAGEFKVPLEFPGQYEVEVTAVGYAKGTLLSPALGDSAAEVKISLALSTGASIAGRVTV
ncbi:MAG TPA: carboxypeptidase-like regulatory domain-containing protein, partial [Candidatus Hydrogenedentes bacterium]|nr:carboxypeptidase-like regulatory domain-containing protein [Candidatus Hydrogenedentota bacterium]